MAKKKSQPKGLEQQLNEVENKIHLLDIHGTKKDKAELAALKNKRIELIKKLGRKP
jgi:hypothetical protein